MSDRWIDLLGENDEELGRVQRDHIVAIGHPKEMRHGGRRCRVALTADVEKLWLGSIQRPHIAAHVAEEIIERRAVDVVASPAFPFAVYAAKGCKPQTVPVIGWREEDDGASGYLGKMMPVTLEPAMWLQSIDDGNPDPVVHTYLTVGENEDPIYIGLRQPDGKVWAQIGSFWECYASIADFDAAVQA